ncbi:5'-nucleotidase, lipoprotein e(P4) family [Vulcaniibacterium gelatinicum]|uniref:5'-nucleotidase, lipoprotein e(P4) family n=1 Tax=Vulcaniibacterium gelatinicum TaxID=2598725 RepID=UPI0011C7F771|nr:HAD family acid phosphatase [Vulcaniibacterium gelatinicum]
MSRILPLAALCAALLVGACRHATPAASAPPPAPAAAVAADDNLNAVLWMQRSVEYRAVTQALYRAAAAQLERALADPAWDALAPAERDTPAAGLPPAVIVDVDETMLDNSPYQARLIRDGIEFDDAGWARWVAERRAQAIPGAVAFAQAAHARGITVIYLSNRDEAQQADTLANLRAAGLPVAEGEVFLGLGTEVPGCAARGSDKTCRRQWVGRHYRVLLQVGDQLGDFVQVPENTPAAREALLARHGAWFGERWWVLPNPSYGGWEAALFDNARDLPRAQRRERKRAALDTAP